MAEAWRIAKGAARGVKLKPRTLTHVVRLANGQYLLRPGWPGWLVTTPRATSARRYCEAGALALAREFGGEIERIA